MTVDDLASAILPLLSALGNAAWQGGIALLLVLLICRLWPRLPGAYQSILWRLAFAKLLLTLIPLGPVTVPLLALPPTIATIRTTAVPAPPQPVAPLPSQATTPIPPLAVAPPAPAPKTLIIIVVALLYVAGVLTISGRALAALIHLRRLRRTASPGAPDIQRLAEDLGRPLNIRRTPPVLTAPSLSTPLLMPGAILLPAIPWETETLRLVLAHELAHVRRRDLAWDALGALARILFFFHPLVLWAWREERIARELAADALALSVTRAPVADYGKLLLTLSVATPRRTDFAGAVGAMESGASLQRRLLALKEGTFMTRRHSQLLLVAMPFALGTLFVPWRMTRAEPPAPSPVASRVTAPRDLPVLPQGTLSLKGRITDRSGTPIERLSVTLWILYPPPASHTYERVRSVGRDVIAETNGTFAFTGLPPGQYAVMIRSEDHSWPETLVQVTLKNAPQNLTIKLGQGTLVSGRVTDRATGKPVAGVIVNTEAPTEKSAAGWRVAYLDRATTDAQGRYAVRVPAGKAFVVVGESAGSTDPAMQEAQRVGIITTRENGSEMHDFRVTTAPVVTFTNENNEPVANAAVMLYAQEPEKHYANYEAETQQDGTLRLRYFHKGTFTATKDDLQAAGTFEVKTDGSLRPTEGVTIDEAPRAEPAGRARIVMTNQAPAALVGKVVNEAGEPIADARVRVTEIDPTTKYGRQHRIARSQQDGTFRVPLSLNGEFYPVVRADGYNQVDVSRNRKFVPQQGEIKNLGSITLVKADGMLTGRILDDKGKPRAKAMVVARGEKTNLSAALSDAQGNFRIVNLVHGEPLRIEVCARGMVSDSGEAMFQSNDSWYRQGIKAGQDDFQVTLRPADKDKVLPASAR